MIRLLLLKKTLSSLILTPVRHPLRNLGAAGDHLLDLMLSPASPQLANAAPSANVKIPLANVNEGLVSWVSPAGPMRPGDGCLRRRTACPGSDLRGRHLHP